MAKEQNSNDSSVGHEIDIRWLLCLLVGIVVAGFFLVGLIGQPQVILVLRGILTLFFLWIIYHLWVGISQVDVDDLIDESTQTSESAIQKLVETPDFADLFAGKDRFNFFSELNLFFENLIHMVRSTFVAHSSIIFLSEKGTDQLRVEFCESQNPALNRGDLIAINGTLPGSVFSNQTAILEQNIPTDGPAVNYYKESVGVKSFIGVPIMIRGEVRGVLAVDSLVANDFSEDDLELMKAYERLISQGIQLLSEREKSQLVNQYLKAQRILLAELSEDLSYENIYSSVGSACRAIYQFDRLTIATIDSEAVEYGMITKVIGQRDMMGEKYRFPLNDGLTGWVIRKNKPLLLGDLEKGDLFRPRYSKEDKSNFGLRSFLGVPIAFKNQVFGVISLESKQPDFYTDWDQNILMLLAANVGLSLLSVHLLPPKVQKEKISS